MNQRKQTKTFVCVDRNKKMCWLQFMGVSRGNTDLGPLLNPPPQKEKYITISCCSKDCAFNYLTSRIFSFYSCNLIRYLTKLLTQILQLKQIPIMAGGWGLCYDHIPRVSKLYSLRATYRKTYEGLGPSLEVYCLIS